MLWIHPPLDALGPDWQCRVATGPWTMPRRVKPTLTLTRLARRWIAEVASRDRAPVLSPLAEELRQALQALRAGRATLAVEVMHRAGRPLRGVAASALRAARLALAAGNRAAAEAALARALLASV